MCITVHDHFDQLLSLLVGEQMGSIGGGALPCVPPMLRTAGAAPNKLAVQKVQVICALLEAEHVELALHSRSVAHDAATLSGCTSANAIVFRSQCASW